jgi:excisionase family DNA binding protein
VKRKSTGKPPRKPYTKVQAAPVGPFDPQRRYTVEQTMAYLSTSRPTIYKLIHAALLEAFKEGRRTYITGRSIAARFLPPPAPSATLLSKSTRKQRPQSFASSQVA